jgi:DNA-binding MarR family transcriptional regulator
MSALALDRASCTRTPLRLQLLSRLIASQSRLFTRTQRQVLCVLIERADKDDLRRPITVREETIAARLGCHRSTVSRAIAGLEKNGGLTPAERCRSARGRMLTTKRALGDDLVKQLEAFEAAVLLPTPKQSPRRISQRAKDFKGSGYQDPRHQEQDASRQDLKPQTPPDQCVRPRSGELPEDLKILTDLGLTKPAVFRAMDLARQQGTTLSCLMGQCDQRLTQLRLEGATPVRILRYLHAVIERGVRPQRAPKPPRAPQPLPIDPMVARAVSGVRYAPGARVETKVLDPLTVQVATFFDDGRVQARTYAGEQQAHEVVAWILKFTRRASETAIDTGSKPKQPQTCTAGSVQRVNNAPHAALSDTAQRPGLRVPESARWSEHLPPWPAHGATQGCHAAAGYS